MTGPRICHSLHRNSPPGGKNKLARSPTRASTKDSNTPTPSPTISWIQIPAPTPTPTLSSNEGLFQQFMKVYLKDTELEPGLASRSNPNKALRTTIEDPVP